MIVYDYLIDYDFFIHSWLYVFFLS